MAKGKAEYAALMLAMADRRPLCLNDDRFIDDDANVAHLREICIQCPVYSWCLSYAKAARPEGAVYAGLRFHKKIID
jgi:hypothetical protein